MRFLVDAVLRALGVTVLLMTALLPAADHHATARLLGELQVSGEDAQWLLVHHHVHPAAARSRAVGALHGRRSVGLAEAAPAAASPVAVLASAPSADAASLASPVAVALAWTLVVCASALCLRAAERPPPASSFQLVPVPPPRRPLLSAAA